VRIMLKDIRDKGKLKKRETIPREESKEQR
jgi:hypothetical protein